MNKLKHLDYLILIPYLLLCTIGSIVIYSASSNVAILQDISTTNYFRNQMIFVVTGVFLVFFLTIFKYDMLKNKYFILAALIFTFVSLIVVLIVADEINGAKAWISIGGIFNYQPAEFAKLVLILYLAFIFSKKQKTIVKNVFDSVWPPMIMFLAIAALVFIQNDVGGVLILTVIALVMMFSSGMPARLGIVSGLLSTGLAGTYIFLVYKFGTKVPLMTETRLSRFEAFWDPFKNAGTAGLQLVQSYLALNNGGIFGRGLGQSIQKLGYLPEPYTDFIIAILAEELGLIAVLVILTLSMILTARVLLVGIRAKDPFGSLVCIGLGTTLMIQTFINLGGVTGWLPITGVTYPFISYGGSSMLVLSAGIGLVLNVSATEKIRVEKEKRKISAQNATN